MNIKQLKRIAALAGLMVGSFAVAVMAESYTWTPPGATAPAGNVPAPINVGGTHQTKGGSLALGGSTASPGGFALDVNGPGYFTGLTVSGSIVVNSLFVNGTDKDKAGYILTNDGNGKAEWKAKGSSSVTLSEVTSFEIAVPRNGGVKSLTTPSTYLFCALTKLGPDYANSNNAGSYCQIQKNVDGKWTISGYRGDDPDNICGMTCFK